MSLIPPRRVHGGVPQVFSRDFLETLRALAAGHPPLDPSFPHDGAGASVSVLGHTIAHSDTIDGARRRALGQLAATMLELVDWKHDEPRPWAPCTTCGESHAEASEVGT